MAIILSGSITVDESGNLQNATATAGIPGDNTDNDITVAAINGTDDTGDLPFAFESRLFALGMSGVPTNTALSGYSGAAGNTGADLLTITGGYIDLAFTDAQGKPLGDPTNANVGSDWSGLYTLDGTQIFLYTDPTNNNIVLGRTGIASGAPNTEDDTADPAGTIVFAAYLEETATGAKVWMVLQEPIKHPDTSNHDDVVDMTDHLWVTASQDLAFDFAGVPPGQHYFLMYKAATGNAGLVVTGMDPDKSPANQADTVNTSTGGGPTTLGSNSQGLKPGAGLIFSFVTDPATQFTVPNLKNTDNNYDDEGNIQFGGLFAASGGSFVISQATPPNPITVKISAFTTGLEIGSGNGGTGFFDGLLDGNGNAVDGADELGYIASVTLLDANGVVVAGFENVTGDKTLNGISVTFDETPDSGGGLNRTVTVTGSLVDFSIQYTLEQGTTHNRAVIQNAGTGNSTFDVGGFHLPNIVAVPQEIGSQLNFEDDGPTATGTAQTSEVDEDGLSGRNNDSATGDLNAADGINDDGDANEAATSGSVASIFQSGADDPVTYGLSTVTSGLQALTSKGAAVSYAVSGNTLTAFVNLVGGTGFDVGDREVFSFTLNATTGAYTFTLKDQLDHAAGNNENDITLNLGSILQATDKDGDTVTAAAEKLVITVDDDTPVVRSITNLVGFNTPLTGRYDFGIGADETGNAAVDGVVLNALGLTGTTSGGRAITDAVVTHQSEDANSVTYGFAFNYFTSSAPSTAQLPASGTVTFNKTDGTFVFDLAAPIMGSTTFSTSDIAGLKTYDTGDANSPEITVKEYDADFVGVLYAQTTDGGKDVILDLKAGGDYTFTAGDTFTSVQAAYINVSTVTLGANSDTLQPYEVLNFDFFVDNPVVPASPSGTPQNPTPTPGAAIDFTTGKALVDTVAITLNQININGEDDVAILLKLRKTSDGTLTTRLLIANSATDYVAVAGTQNHVVTIGTDDYDSANYQIYGVQVLASTENVLGGTAVSLSDHSVVTLTSGNGTYADTSDNDVLKIVKIDVTISRPADADLNFTGKVIDADGDSTPNFNFSVHLESDSQVLTGSAGSDYLNGTSAADTMSGGAGADFMTGGAGADQFVFAAGNSGITLATADTITDFLTGVDTIATSMLAGNATIASGDALADFAAFVTAANAVLTAGAGTNDVYVAYNAAVSGNAWAVVDENDSGSVDAGDTVIVLVGVNLAGEVAPGDFV